jgi:hypothetical protein
MARYTGPKLELLVNLKAISEMIKHSKEEVTHLDNGMAKRGKICYPVNGEAKAKYSYGILETIQRFIQKHQLLKVLLVKFFTIM